MSRTSPLAAAVVFSLAVGMTSCSDGTGTSSATTASSPVSTTEATTTSTTMLPCTPPTSGRHTIEHNGLEREYVVAAPTAVTAPAPVLVLFHGFSSNPDAMLAATGLEEAAPAAGVVLVAPLASGEPTSWEIAGNRVDDVGLVDALLAEVRTSDCVDPDRVWVAGNSAGSAFSSIYACKRPGTVEGMGLNAGLAPAICPSEVVTQMLVFNGTADPVVSFEGGPQPVGNSTIQLDPVPVSVGKWAELGGCATEPVEVRRAPDVRTLAWDDCPGTTQVTLHVLEGHGHNWPGAPQVGAIGPVNQTLDASCLLLHRMTRKPGDGYDQCVDAYAEPLQ